MFMCTGKQNKNTEWEIDLCAVHHMFFFFWCLHIELLWKKILLAKSVPLSKKCKKKKCWKIYSKIYALSIEQIWHSQLRETKGEFLQNDWGDVSRHRCMASKHRATEGRQESLWSAWTCAPFASLKSPIKFTIQNDTRTWREGAKRPASIYKYFT